MRALGFLWGFALEEARVASARRDGGSTDPEPLGEETLAAWAAWARRPEPEPPKSSRSGARRWLRRTARRTAVAR